MDRATRTCQSLRHPPKYVLASLVVSLGGFLFGLDTGTIGPITVMPQFADVLGNISSTVHGLVVSSILLPAAASSFFCGHLADWLGRPRAMAVGGALFCVGNCVEAATVNLGMLIAGRVVTGLGEGLFLSTVVVYICEISPPQHRGPLASLPQLFVSLSICIGYFICYGSVNLESSFAWRLPWMIQATIAFVFTICSLLLLPESPRWLSQVGREAETDNVWNQLGVSNTEREKAEERPFAPNNATAQAAVADKKGNIFLRVFGKNVWKRTAMGIFLMGMQQLSGIDGVLYYAPLLFKQAGLTSSSASFLASGVSAILMFLVTIPATIYSDKWGRRSSTIYGGIGILTCMFLIGSLYASNSVHGEHGPGRWVVIVAIYIYALVFSMSWAVAIKVWTSEVQTPETRAPASSLAYTSNWIVNWTVAFTTPIFLAKSTFGVYFLFGASILLTVVVCVFFMPETRGKTLEEINESFDKGHSVSIADVTPTVVRKHARRRKNPTASEFLSNPIPLRTLEDAMVQ